MTEFNTNTYAELKEDFIKQTKKVLKDNISKNPDTLKRYEIEIIEAHHKIASYFNSFFDSATRDIQEYCHNEILYIREKTLKCFGRLVSRTKLPTDLFTEINIDDLTENSENSNSESESELDLYNSKSLNNTILPQKQGNNSEKPLHVKMTGNNDNSTPSGVSNTQSSDDKEMQFCRYATSTIPRYSGDPLALTAFVNAVKLVRSVCRNRHEIILKNVIMTKLEGKALEVVDEEGEIDDILDELSTNIKPISSKVIISRMNTLKLNKLTSDDYVMKAEELAEALQRAYVFEGIRRHKAKEMVIEKTVEMCRLSTRSPHVQLTLSSGIFNSASEAIAKLITETTFQQQLQSADSQVLAYRAQNNRNRNFRGNGNFSNNRNDRGYNNGRNFYRNNGRNFSNRSRGRGNFRGRNGNFRGNRNQYNVRVAENATAPTEERGNANQQASIFTLERVNRH